MWIGIGVVVVIVAIAAVFFVVKDFQGSPSAGLLECKTYSYNGEGATNLVFFSPEEDVNKFMNSLYEFEPFGDNKDILNVYYIDDYQPECEIYKGIALLCYSKDVVKTAGSCPNDVIVVTQDQPRKIRSSAYMNVISLNNNLPASVFTHEFAHAFANLADEYVPTVVSAVPTDTSSVVANDLASYLNIL